MLPQPHRLPEKGGERERKKLLGTRFFGPFLALSPSLPPSPPLRESVLEWQESNLFWHSKRMGRDKQPDRHRWKERREKGGGRGVVNFWHRTKCDDRSGRLQGDRVGRNFACWGDSFLWLTFSKMTEIGRIWSYFFAVEVSRRFGPKNGLGYILGDIFTNASGHPDRLLLLLLLLWSCSHGCVMHAHDIGPNLIRFFPKFFHIFSLKPPHKQLL
jgi:hypothetical protein